MCVDDNFKTLLTEFYRYRVACVSPLYYIPNVVELPYCKSIKVLYKNTGYYLTASSPSFHRNFIQVGKYIGVVQTKVGFFVCKHTGNDFEYDPFTSINYDPNIVEGIDISHIIYIHTPPGLSAKKTQKDTKYCLCTLQYRCVYPEYR